MARKPPRSRGRGSSPLTRGKLTVEVLVTQPVRLIPAHAGKTVYLGLIMVVSPAHPRSRGENSPRPSMRSMRAGSSPLTRGKRSVGRTRGQAGRLIPAHAGKTRPPAEAADGTTAHPRSRGENTWQLIVANASVGSSPLTRGKRLRGGLRLLGGRLIPAHAGKTADQDLRRLYRAAHPRSRGENDDTGGESRVINGSSPLTRGKPKIERLACLDGRLIPAHAGKTRYQAKHSSISAAHPRSRGENASELIDGLTPIGSSPLTRGKPLTAFVLTAITGLIPAHAGKTMTDSHAHDTHAAHPRSRGENRLPPAGRARTRGSSPLTRGKQSTWTGRPSPRRLIPAHAGKTGSPRPRRCRSWAHPRSRGENVNL